MEKIKKFFNNLTSNYKQYIKQYMATNVAIIITALVFTFVNYEELGKILGQFAIIAIISAINFFTIETYCKKTKTKIISYIPALAISVGAERLLTLNNYSSSIVRILVGYAIIIFLIGVYGVIKKSKLDFDKYCIRVFKNLFGTGLIYLILAVGFMLIMTVTINLLFTNSNYEILLRTQIAIVGLFLVPATLISITNTESEPTKYIEILVKFVLLPLTIIATIIIYIYMIKILCLREIPKNSIYRIITGLFIVAFPVWVMAYEFKERSKAIEKLCKWMPIAFMPLIGLQIYSLGARISENALTQIRYIGIMFIIFEAMAIILSIIKNRKYLIHTITTAVVLLAVTTIIPIINMEDASNYSQAKRFSNAWKEGTKYEELTKEEKQTATGAYIYLKAQKNAQRYIPDYITEENLKELLKENYYYTEQLTKTINYKLPEDGVIYVNGYNYIQEINIYKYNLEEKELENIKLNNIFSINMKEYILKLIEENNKNNNNAEEYIINNRVLKINDSRDLYIQKLRINYSIDPNEQLEKIWNIDIEGYILIK